MERLVIYSRKARSYEGYVEELVAYTLQSSAWTDAERENLTDAIHRCVADWMDAAIAKGDR